MSISEVTIAAGVGLVAIAIGAAIGCWQCYAVGTSWQRRDVTGPVPPADVSSGDYARVTGEAVPADDGTLTAPLSGADAVGYRYRIEQQTEGVGWWTVAEGGDSVEFEVQGASSAITVRPRGTPPDVDMLTSVVGPGASLPEDVRARMRESSVFRVAERPEFLMAPVDERRRYREGAVTPGSDVVVYGKAGIVGRIREATIDADSSARFRFGTSSQSAVPEPDTTSTFDFVFWLVLAGMFVATGIAFLVASDHPAIEAVLIVW